MDREERVREMAYGIRRPHFRRSPRVWLGSRRPPFDALLPPSPQRSSPKRRVQRPEEEAAAAAHVGATEVPSAAACPATAGRRSPERDRRTRAATSRSAPGGWGSREVKRTIKHIHPFSVLKVSLFLYSVFLVVWLIFVAVVYSFVDSAGLFEPSSRIFGKGMVLWENVDISLGLGREVGVLHRASAWWSSVR